MPAHTLRIDARARRITEDIPAPGTERPDPTDPTGHRRERAAVRVTTAHDRDRRAIVSSVRRIMLRDLGGFHGPYAVGLADSPPVPPVVVPLARYSAAALRTAHEDYVSAHLASQAQAAAALAWARELAH
jgi:hypothetical protein